MVKLFFTKTHQNSAGEHGDGRVSLGVADKGIFAETVSWSNPLQMFSFIIICPVNRRFSLLDDIKVVTCLALSDDRVTFVLWHFLLCPRDAKHLDLHCVPKDLAVKGAKARGKQISIKSISNIGSKPTRNWEPDEPTTEVVMA